MIKFTRSSKKKLEKARNGSSSSQSRGGSGHRSRHRSSGEGGGGGDRSVSSAYSAHSQYSARSDYTDGVSAADRQQPSNSNSNHHSRGPMPPSSGGGALGNLPGGDGGHGNGRRGGGSRAGRSARGGQRQGGDANGASSTGGGRRFSTAQSVASISSASVFAPSVVGGEAASQNVGLQPSSARLLRDLNSSNRSSLLSSLGTAASRTFRSYKMSLPRCPPPIKFHGGRGGMSDQGEDAPLPPVETDLELLGRTVHAVSSALTEPPREGDRFMIYDVSFNPKGCVWDALIVVQFKDDADNTGDDEGSNRSGMSKSSRGGRSSRKGRSSTSNDSKGEAAGSGRTGTFTFPIRVTCAEDDEAAEAPPPAPAARRIAAAPDKPRAKTYAVDLSVIDDSAHHPIGRWSNAEAAEHRDDIKDAMEWVSFAVRRSMARSMFPTFPEGCQGKPFREMYQLNKKLKSGTFSTVCRGVHRSTGRQVAVKCILRKKIEPSVDAAVFEEVLIMSGLHHKYICPMIDYFEEDRCHFVVMELEKGGDLCERINEKVTYSEQDARTVVRNVCEAMEFVHSRGFAHCDIKPRNYLLRSKRDDVDVRLADFGFAQHVHAPNSLTSQCGTPFFVAPEVINRKPYDQKVDMWSIGITTYLLLCGDTPFNGKNRQQLFRRISCDEPTFSNDKWGHVSDEGVDFVRKLLAKDPAKRLSAAGALSHRWLVESRIVESNGAALAHPSSGGESSEEVLVAKRSAARSLAKPSASAAGRRPGDAASRERPQAARRPGKNRSASRESVRKSISREPVPRARLKDRAASRESASRDRAKDRSVSRESVSRGRANAGAPPPPPKSHATPREGGGGVSERANYSGVTSDENQRLLDVIKSQDAKIEKLERMMKKLLEPEGDVHEC